MKLLYTISFEVDCEGKTPADFDARSWIEATVKEEDYYRERIVPWLRADTNIKRPDVKVEVMEVKTMDAPGMY